MISMEKMIDVVGLGNALVDFVVNVDSTVLDALKLRKGEMHLVDERRAKELLDVLKNKEMEIIPGGSAANTVKGVAWLGGKAILCGSVGNDTYGYSFVTDAQDHGVMSRLKTHPTATTGHAITFITPDAQRTFSVHLGAAIYMHQDDIPEEDLAAAKVLHIEGYQLEGRTQEAVLFAMELAKKAGTKVSIDLADPSLIRRTKALLQRVLMDYADLVFLNETEAKEFTGKDPEDAIQELAQYAGMVVLKLGERGSLILANGAVTKIDAVPAKAIDTTGAGDSYAAGFLYGLCQGWALEKCGKLGSLFASKIVEQKGVRMTGISKEELMRNV